MKRQIVTMVLSAVITLGTATTLFASPGCDVFHVYCSASTLSH